MLLSASLAVAEVFSEMDWQATSGGTIIPSLAQNEI